MMYKASAYKSIDENLEIDKENMTKILDELKKLYNSLKYYGDIILRDALLINEKINEKERDIIRQEIEKIGEDKALISLGMLVDEIYDLKNITEKQKEDIAEAIENHELFEPKYMQARMKINQIENIINRCLEDYYIKQ